MWVSIPFVDNIVPQHRPFVCALVRFTSFRVSASLIAEPTDSAIRSFRGLRSWTLLFDLVNRSPEGLCLVLADHSALAPLNTLRTGPYDQLPEKLHQALLDVVANMRHLLAMSCKRCQHQCKERWQVGTLVLLFLAAISCWRLSDKGVIDRAALCCCILFTALLPAPGKLRCISSTPSFFPHLHHSIRPCQAFCYNR